MTSPPQPKQRRTPRSTFHRSRPPPGKAPADGEGYDGQECRTGGHKHLEAGMAKGPGGRPTKYRPEMCEAVIEAGREGFSLAEMADTLDIHYSTFLAWQEEKPEFSEAVKEARRKSQAWWERMGRVATFGGVDGFNSTSYIFQMKNRFREDWADTSRTELSGPDGGAIPVETKGDAIDRLECILAGIASRESAARDTGEADT